MQPDKSRLVIHTGIAPGAEEFKGERPTERIKWRVLKHPLSKDRWRPWERASKAPKSARPKGRQLRPELARVRPQRTAGERLLTNTAIACALLLGITALGKVDAPWTRQVAQTVSSAMTMRVNLDDTLGKLNFVRDWMPDAALGFWNMGAHDALARPVAGALTHGYDAGQPWLLYQVSGEQPVYAAAAGRVAAVSENAGGEWTLMIDHEAGEQTVYAYLGKVIVKAGQTVERGAPIGVTQDLGDARMYFELRVSGASADPTARLRGA
ncbi:MAG: M23 family metallopeptidase [Christensenellaceae bacterium]|nr:M23 family metallopeptidase [Christensenellaceae bacterium]